MFEKRGVVGMRVEEFEHLEVYKHALVLQQEIFDLTFSFPEDEKFLTKKWENASVLEACWEK